MHRSVREPERTIGQLVSDPLFLPALIYSGTTAGENIPAIRVSASSVYVGPLGPPSPPIGMSFTRCYRVKHADEILKHRFYSVQLTI